MSGAVLGADGERVLCRCPECGRDVRSERELGRNRRSSAKGCVGASLIVLAYALLATPRVVSSGWKGAIPTAGLIVGMWVAPRQPEELETVQRNGFSWEYRKRNGWIDYSCEVLAERIKASEVWSWQKELAARLAIRRVDRQLDQWPPRYDDGLSSVIEAALGLSWGDDSDRTNHLVAVHLEFPKTVVAGCPLPVIVSSTGFGRADIVAEVTFDWPGAKPVIIQTLSPTGNFIQGLAVTQEEYFRRGKLLDGPTEPGDSVRLTVRLNRTNGSRYEPPAWTEPALRTRVYTVPLKVLRQDEKPLARLNSVSSPAETRMWRAKAVYLSGSFDEIAIDISDRREPGYRERVFPEKVGVGVRAELLKDGVVHGSALCALSGNTWYPHCTPMSWLSGRARIRFALKPPHTAAFVLATLDQWSIRLVGDECAARQDFDATSYWAGEMTLPLEPASHR